MSIKQSLRGLFIATMTGLTAACGGINAASPSSSPLTAETLIGSVPVKHKKYESISLITHLRPDFQYFAGMWDNYQKSAQNGKLDELITKCRGNPDQCNPRFIAWVYGIDALNLIPKEYEVERLNFANILVSDLMRYDNEKGTLLNALFPSENWLHTEKTTLIERNGLGTCGDYAVLLYRTLLKSGFHADFIDILAGATTNGALHLVVRVETKSQTYIFDPSHGSSDSDPILATEESYMNGSIIPISSGFSHPAPFKPMWSLSESGVKPLSNGIVGAIFIALADDLTTNYGDHPIAKRIEATATHKWDEELLKRIRKRVSQAQYYIFEAMELPDATLTETRRSKIVQNLPMP